MGDYLIHYGVKGMKWGVRHDPDDKFLKSRRVMKKAFKKSAKAHERSNGYSGGIYTGTSSTGKNYDAVREAHLRDRKPIEDWKKQQYKKIDKKYKNDPEKWSDAELKIWNNPEFKKRKAAVNRKYVHKLNQAKLKDIGVTDLKRGEQYMKKYGLAYRIEDGELRYGRYTVL